MKKPSFRLVLGMAARSVGLAIERLMQADRKKVFSVLERVLNGLLKTALGWLVFFGGSVLLLLFNYYVTIPHRQQHIGIPPNGNLLTGGPETEAVVFLIYTVCAAIAIVLACRGTVHIRYKWLCCLLVILQILVAAVLWLLMHLYYGIVICTAPR